MAAYDVFVQGVFYKTIEAPYTHNVLTRVTLDIQDGLVPDFDETKPQMITIQPVGSSAPVAAPTPEEI